MPTKFVLISAQKEGDSHLCVTSHEHLEEHGCVGLRFPTDTVLTTQDDQLIAQLSHLFDNCDRIDIALRVSFDC